MTNLKTNKQTSNPFLMYGGVIAVLIFLDVLFLILFHNEVNAFKLTEKEMVILDSDRQIIAASAEISQKYSDQITTISAVFPSEQTFPLFIQELETELKNGVSEYQFKFSPNPIAEGDKLFLLLNISLKTDASKFLAFLDRLEKMPYMTHVTAITAKTPGGFSAGSDYVVGIKIYVQNPFRSK